MVIVRTATKKTSVAQQYPPCASADPKKSRLQPEDNGRIRDSTVVSMLGGETLNTYYPNAN